MHDAFTPIVRFITMFGNAGLFWILISLVLILNKKTRKLGILAGLSLLLCFIVCNLWLKPTIDRTRPWVLFEEVRRLIPAPHDPSFPSGHSANSMACAMAILLNGKKKCYGAAAVTLAVLIALSRLYLGVHFPSDVVGGLVLGVLSAVIVYYANARYERRRDEISD